MYHEYICTMTTRRVIRTVREAVNALGGTKKTADLLEVQMPAVSNMLAAGRFSQGHHLIVYLALSKRGCEVDTTTLFGMPKFLTEQSDSKSGAHAA